MRLVTWNVNSLNARLDRVTEWLTLRQPDVVCLQETKLANDEFPHEVFLEMGYESAHHGQGQWNGVAILSRVGLEDVHLDFGDGDDPDVDARIIWATCQDVRIASCYVPNGRSLDDDHYQYKLAWLDRLRADVAANATADDDVCVVGDFNIAPDSRDIYDAETHVGVTHVSEPERQRLDSPRCVGTPRHIPRPPRRAWPLQLVGLSERRLSHAPRDAHRSDPCDRFGPLENISNRGRPQRPKGKAAKRPCPCRRRYRSALEFGDSHVEAYALSSILAFRSN